MNTKICRKCGETKSTSDFHKKLSSSDGLHSYCKKCAIEGAKKAYRKLNQKERMEKQAKKSKAALLKVGNDIKVKHGCVVCLEKCPSCLDFHHIDPSIKDREVSRFIYAKAIKKVIPEINKCVVLCRNCHAKFHAGLIKFNKKLRCNEDLDYWTKIYKEYRKEIYD